MTEPLVLGSYVPLALTEVKELQVQALVDSGADYSVVCEALLLRAFGRLWLDGNITQPANTPRFRLGDGQTASAISLAQFPLKLGGKEFQIHFVIKSGTEELVWASAVKDNGSPGQGGTFGFITAVQSRVEPDTIAAKGPTRLIEEGRSRLVIANFTDKDKKIANTSGEPCRRAGIEFCDLTMRCRGQGFAA